MEKMKNIFLKYVFVVFALFALFGCEDVLDTEDYDSYSEDLVYSEYDQVLTLVYTAYNSTESWAIDRTSWWGRRFNIEIGSYEAKFNFNNIDQFNIRGGWTPSNTGLLEAKWATFWDYVRATDEFLDEIDDSEAMSSDPDDCIILKGEMRFLRANLYSKLLKYYGGVPILESALGTDDDFDEARDSYKDCVDFIVEDLDYAISVLPETRPDDEFGRATKLSALAVKSRTLLYAASPLHDPSTAPSNDDLYIYDVSSKWQDAADAAKTLIDLVDSRDLTSVADADAYQKLFLSNTNEDILFARAYGSTYYEFGTDANSLPDQCQSPNGYGGWGLSSPSQNFVAEFNMADGTAFVDNAIVGDGITYDSSIQNDNREMRYYANILYNGAEFRDRDVQYWVRTDVEETGGLDSKYGDGNTNHASKTGYNIRKFQDESVDVAGGISAGRPYILYRLAEIYLNYAECEYHLGDEDLAREYLNKVSERALQPDITATGADLLEAIKRERRIELCFEGHNFFDERRWMNEDHLGFDVNGLSWTKSSEDADAVYTEYTVVTRPWKDAYYYLPIPETEVEKDPSLVQNYGY
jgi:hypothetical protein